MIIKTSHVRQGPRRFAGTEPADILELGTEAGFQVSGDVRYELTAQRFAAELLVRGVLEMDVSSRCARCGKPCRQTVRDPAFARSYPLSAANDELIDLTADIREAILLALPMNFLCSEACRGVCLQCGADLNKAPCACGSPRFQTRWGPLDQLKLNQ